MVVKREGGGQWWSSCFGLHVEVLGDLSSDSFLGF